MAEITIVPADAVLNGAAYLLFTAFDGTDGLFVDYSRGVDTRIAVLLRNGAASEAAVTVKQGDGIQAVTDLAVTVPANGFAVLCLDSGSFKICAGDSDNKGSVHLTGPATVSAAAVVMV